MLLLIHERDWCWHISEEGWSDAVEGSTALHGAAYLLIVPIICSLLEKGEWDVNSTDPGGNTPFLWAARKGHEDAVWMLLAQLGVDPDRADAGGRTPLFWAAHQGHEGVVKQLPERADANSDMTDLAGETALSQAVRHGHHAIIKLLSERKILIPLSGCDKSTTLSPPQLPDPDQRHFKRLRRF